MRLRDKTLITRSVSPQIAGLPSDFNKLDFEAAIRTKGINVIHEKAYMCPCLSNPSNAAQSNCQNCGGSGWFFANPTATKMLVQSIMLDDKLKEAALAGWGILDLGTAKITGYNQDKLTYMDRITIIDTLSEHNEMLHPKSSDEEDEFFAYTKYNISDVNFLGLFDTVDQKIRKLDHGTDYEFIDNVIRLSLDLHIDENQTLTIRYMHYPVYHVIDILRESMTSYEVQGTVKQILPVHAICKRAHVIKDVENMEGDRLLDNSWLPSCASEGFTDFQRQLRHTSIDLIYDSLTQMQKDALDVLLSDSDSF